MNQPRRPIGRRQLGTELRRLRIEAGKNQREVAEVLECDTSQISKVEKGERALKVLELTALLNFLGVDAAKRDEILSLGQEARKRQPRHVYSDALPGAFRRLGDLEEDAAEIFDSSGELIPGLLQTPDYVRALVRNAISSKQSSAEDEIEARVAFRLDRQKLLDRDDPPRMWFIIGEPALRRPIGGDEVMAGQLRRLLAIMDDQPWITIQVIPIMIGAHPLLSGSLTAFRFTGGAADIVHQTTVFGSGVYTDDENDTRDCFRAYDKLRASALGPQPSREFIAECVREFDQ
ncbi:helix-turn-helix domain-containing protein [Amycolatopsis sp. H20-H5]|uniref:helix-turn-helix domain-containing protein n=1 Tax=Amycolatopsis sp. H20-H5 TaxID=3046309 RepID=UPI002DBED235|nr:helix-turn-helix transcriptional regulator [Amycolatopsis sp. H20-H5]MEC3976558.1 helix-turn-helix transcriptional regulator [Amycolatopsis sp. H20-H5]